MMMGWHGQGKCHDDKKSIILDKLVDLLSVLIFNFSKKMKKITVILRWWWDGMDGASVTTIRRALLDKLVDLLSVPIFNFNKNDDDLDDDGMAWTGQVSRR